MKLDLSINRGMTINAGNYNSIKPNVSIVVHDVDHDDLERVYKSLSNVVDSLFALETIKMCDEMETIKEKGLGKYHEILESIANIASEQLSNFSKDGVLE